MRTFIAIPLSAECRDTLGRMQQPLRETGADVRWVAVPSIHLTLKFLGEADSLAIPALARELRSEAGTSPPFRLRMRGLGAFPHPGNPRVLWCGLDGETGALNILQRRVEAASVRLGFAPDHRPFRPHLTLGRVMGKRNLSPLADCIKMGAELEAPLRVDRFHIYQSTLKPQGAVYTVLETISLTGD
ncbi:MAG: RNA 2',3'-cyclic phosphodiesterase [Acidobacteria bacterium]|nr:RNA 2',3'-cyclic phosphodiesterase [Acidobacteriota bacterium]